METHLPQPGQRYRLLNDNLCQIVTLATDSQTTEKMVVYQELFGNYEVFVCPLSRFMEERDKQKTLGAEKKNFRKEKPDFSFPESLKKPVSPEPLPEGIHPKLMAFLDAKTDEERYEILCQAADVMDDHMIDTMAVVLDMVIEDGPIEVRYQELKNCLRTRMRFETMRLR